MENKKEPRIYFNGLDALRFFAALSVLIGHVELTKHYLQLPNKVKLFEYLNFGGMGVYFFFVLSGFLITYLLLAEKQMTGSIHIGKFYLRRVLRIWPLYFLLITLGFYILPQFEFFKLFSVSFQKNFNAQLWMYICILPNLAFSLYPPVPHIGHLWSIGVEEQFYLFWPVIVKMVRQIIPMLLVLIVVYLGIKVVLFFIPPSTLGEENYRTIKLFFGMTKFECMLIGGFGGAVLFYKKDNLLQFFYSRFIFYPSIILFPLFGFLAAFPSSLQNVMHLPLSMVFLVIIMNIASNPNSGIKLKSTFLNYLGKISYGIYMYHFMVVFIVVKFCRSILIDSSWIGNILAYGVSIVVSILVAHLSYQFFEVHFIKMKTRFSRILSGSE